MTRKAVTREVIERSVSRTTKASMALEGRTVPADFVRSENVERFLEERFRKERSRRPA